MRQHWQRVLLMSAMILALGAPALLAQKYEINPYVGGYWPTHTNVGQLRSEGLAGLRLGVFLDPSFELEGNFGYLNHFNVEQVSNRTRGFLWELAGDYNFSERDWPVVRQFTPFLVVGAGGLTTFVGSSYTFTASDGIATPFGVTLPRTVTVNDRDTFFNVSYGGGIKSVRLAGPLGLRFDVRGRTIPNYYHSTPTWLEVTGGINFMWGEK
jgi:hypothetical protein